MGESLSGAGELHPGFSVPCLLFRAFPMFGYAPAGIALACS
jgi:hypothetical protein